MCRLNDLRLSIRQTYAAIGIESRTAQQSIQSPPGELQIKQPVANMDFSSTRGQLQIDSSKAWHALGKGPHLEWNQAIYSRMKSVFMENLAEEVEAGHRMADITNSRSAFADLARAGIFKSNPVDYQVETPNYDNVRLTYTPGDISTVIEASPIEIEYTPIKPEIIVEPGKLDIYLRQRNSISIDVSTYDLYK